MAALLGRLFAAFRFYQRTAHTRAHTHIRAAHDFTISQGAADHRQERRGGHRAVPQNRG